MSLLDAHHLSDVALKAIAEVARLKSFSTEGDIIAHSETFISTFTWKYRSNSVQRVCALGNNQLTDISWTALCSSSQGLRRLHTAECPRMTDAGLRSVAALKNLQHLDISLCNKSVCCCGCLRLCAFLNMALHDGTGCTVCISGWVILGSSVWLKVPHPPNSESWMSATAVASLMHLSWGFHKGA